MSVGLRVVGQSACAFECVVTSEQNASRELEEENGATTSRLISLGRVYPDAGALSEYDDFIYAEVESYGEIAADEAIVELLPISLSEFERMIRENEMADGFTLTAYALAKARGLLQESHLIYTLKVMVQMALKLRNCCHT
ncbi:MAG TPA: hypothetical protein VIX20_11580 [Ktedonobacteraceae bacterium]